MTPQAEKARRLLRLTKRDQGTFGLLLSLPQSELSALRFHAQQSTEKALKAVTVHAGLTVSRTHDLVRWVHCLPIVVLICPYPLMNSV
jgi:HEPN domain-containing protein